MKNAFIIYGTALCFFFAYASYRGWSVVDSLKSGAWGPAGRSAYHK